MHIKLSTLILYITLH